jgi:CRISPR-associated protein Cas1
MTLKGKKNHYNIKVLSGYGVSVSVKEKKIVLRENPDPFSKSETESWFIGNMPYEKIVISGKGYLSTDALNLLCTHNRNLVLVDSHGKPTCMINGVMNSTTATKYRMAQYDSFRNDKVCKKLSRKTIHDKLESQIRFLKSIDRDDSYDIISKLENYLTILSEDNFENIEKTSAKAYFSYYTSLFDKKYGFDSRNQSFVRQSKKNATDPINALINYGYSVLAGEICKFVYGFGLDPYYGYMHKSHSGFMALVYDVIEPFRWLVESAVYHIVNTSSKQHRLRLMDFAYTRDGSVVLSNKIKKNFLEKLERIFQQERKYEFRHGAKTKDGLKFVQEITVTKIMIQNIIEYCLCREKELKI